MSIHLEDKKGKGISPQAFLQSLDKNREALMKYYELFAWTDEEDRRFFQSMKSDHQLQCFILAAEWCGDVVRNVPVVLHVLAEAEIPTEILIMEEHLDVMDQFLTMGGRAIPIVIFNDQHGEVKGKWGPRPEHVQAVMVAFKQQNPDREAPDYQEKIAVARAEMVNTYGEGTEYQTVIVKELRELIASII